MKVKTYVVTGIDVYGESNIYGIYPTEELAQYRIDHIEDDYPSGEDVHNLWIHECELGPEGADLELNL